MKKKAVELIIFLFDFDDVTRENRKQIRVVTSKLQSARSLRNSNPK